MARPLIMMAICVLVSLALPRFTYGHPATDYSGSTSNMLLAYDLKLEDFPDHEQKKAIATTFVRGSTSIPVKLRQKRQSDQRLAELETLITLSLLSTMLLEMRNEKKLNPATPPDRRKRATTRLTSAGPSPIVKHRRYLVN